MHYYIFIVKLKLGKSFSYTKLISKDILEVGAATLDRKVSNFARENNLGNLFLHLRNEDKNWVETANKQTDGSYKWQANPFKRINEGSIQSFYPEENGICWILRSVRICFYTIYWCITCVSILFIYF